MIYDLEWCKKNIIPKQQVELTFKTGEVILVYGDMDEDGFYMGELDGVRGLVPSNFLTEATEQYGDVNKKHQNFVPGATGSIVAGAQRTIGDPAAAAAAAANRNRAQGPGARGPPPPPRDNLIGGAGIIGGTTAGLNQMNQRTGGGLFRKGTFHI